MLIVVTLLRVVQPASSIRLYLSCFFHYPLSNITFRGSIESEEVLLLFFWNVSDHHTEICWCHWCIFSPWSLQTNTLFLYPPTHIDVFPFGYFFLQPRCVPAFWSQHVLITVTTNIKLAAERNYGLINISISRWDIKNGNGTCFSSWCIIDFYRRL